MTGDKLLGEGHVKKKVVKCMGANLGITSSVTFGYNSQPNINVELEQCFLSNNSVSLVLKNGS